MQDWHRLQNGLVDHAQESAAATERRIARNVRAMKKRPRWHVEDSSKVKQHRGHLKSIVQSTAPLPKDIVAAEPAEVLAMWKLPSKKKKGKGKGKGRGKGKGKGKGKPSRHDSKKSKSGKSRYTGSHREP